MITADTRTLYDALPPLPEFPGERTWVDRLRTWADFQELGPLVAENLLALREGCIGDYNTEFRALAPELHDLLLETFAR